MPSRRGRVLWAHYVQGATPGEIFRTLYFSDTWQAMFASWHSFPVWGVVAAAAWWLRRPALSAFAASGLLHLAMDFPVHADDPHRHVWPLSGWRFYSPVSYWNPAHHGDVLVPLETALILYLLAFLMRPHRSLAARSALSTALAGYVAVKASFAFGLSWVLLASRVERCADQATTSAV